MSIKSLRKLIKEAIEQKYFKAIVRLDYSADKNITEIIDLLRAVCSVTVINSSPSESISVMKQRSRLEVKFYLTSPSIKEHLQKMVSDALNIDGIYSFRIIGLNAIKTK